MPITRVYWIIFILNHFCHILYIYICIYIFIKLVIFFFFFFVIFNCNNFSALYAKDFEIWKTILWNWWVVCFIARSIKWCDILGAHSESIFPFMLYFFFFFHSRKLCFLRFPCLLLISESISLDTSSKPTVGFFLKIAFSSWIIW